MGLFMQFCHGIDLFAAHLRFCIEQVTQMLDKEKSIKGQTYF